MGAGFRPKSARTLWLSSPQRALQGWNAQFAKEDEGLAIDGKTMRNAIDEEGRQAHILGVVGHESGTCHSQKKSVPCR